MTRAPYYRDDLAWVHHTGYAGYVANARREDPVGLARAPGRGNDGLV